MSRVTVWTWDVLQAAGMVPVERYVEVSRDWRAKGDAFNNQRNYKLGKTPLMSSSDSPNWDKHLSFFFFVPVPSLWAFWHHQPTLCTASYELTLPLSGGPFPLPSLSRAVTCKDHEIFFCRRSCNLLVNRFKGAQVFFGIPGERKGICRGGE